MINSCNSSKHHKGEGEKKKTHDLTPAGGLGVGGWGDLKSDNEQSLPLVQILLINTRVKDKVRRFCNTCRDCYRTLKPLYHLQGENTRASEMIRLQKKTKDFFSLPLDVY